MTRNDCTKKAWHYPRSDFLSNRCSSGFQRKSTLLTPLHFHSVSNSLSIRVPPVLSKTDTPNTKTLPLTLEFCQHSPFLRFSEEIDTPNTTTYSHTLATACTHPDGRILAAVVRSLLWIGGGSAISAVVCLSTRVGL
jgi:hypothetical protein